MVCLEREDPRTVNNQRYTITEDHGSCNCCFLQNLVIKETAPWLAIQQAILSTWEIFMQKPTISEGSNFETMPFRSIFQYNSLITLCEFLTRVNIFHIRPHRAIESQSHLMWSWTTNPRISIEGSCHQKTTPTVGMTVLNGEWPTGLDSEKTEELCAKVSELTGQRRILP